MSRPLAPKGGNDDIMTPPDLALKIINYFNPQGRILEPCRGSGAFYNQLKNCDWAEIKDGRDFLNYEFNNYFNWIITNPPWSKFRPFLQRSMVSTDNIVFLCLVNAFFMKARLRDMEENNFRIKEILFVDTPPKPWPQTGFQLGCVHIKKNYIGDIRINNL